MTAHFPVFLLIGNLVLAAWIYAAGKEFAENRRDGAAADLLIWANLCPLVRIRGRHDRYLTIKEGLHDAGVAAFAATAGLSEREQKILNYIFHGRGNRHIIKLPGISYHTVKHHLTSIYRKSGCRNRMDIVEHCRRGYLRGDCIYV